MQVFGVWPKAGKSGFGQFLRIVSQLLTVQEVLCCSTTFMFPMLNVGEQW